MVWKDKSNVNLLTNILWQKEILWWAWKYSKTCHSARLQQMHRVFGQEWLHNKQLFHQQMDLEVNKETALSPTGLDSEQLHSQLSQLKIISYGHSSGLGLWPDTGGWKGASNSVMSQGMPTLSTSWLEARYNMHQP